jgi:large subunit ribosomal protein L29
VVDGDKKMKKFEMIKMSEVELRKRVKDEEENLIHLKFQKATSQLESPIKVRTVRRDIARMKTLLRNFELKEKEAAVQTPNKAK